MWEMLYSLLESEHHIVFLLLVTLFPIFCSLLSSHFFAALSSVFFFFSLLSIPFSSLLLPLRELYSCLLFFFFTLLAAQLHFCLSPSTFLATDVERSPGSPQIRCCWWPPNSSYIAAHHRVREAISVFISSSLQLVVRSWLRRAKTSRKWCAWGTLEPLYVRKSKSPKYLM